MKFNNLLPVFCILLALASLPIDIGCKETALQENTNYSSRSDSSAASLEISPQEKEKTPNSIFQDTEQLPATIKKEDLLQESEKVEDFSPKGWYLMEKAEGDLNGDGKPDAAAVFSKAKPFSGKDDGSHSSQQPSEDIATRRLLVIALRKEDGLLHLDEISQKAILCRACGAQSDDPFVGVSIKTGSIILTHTALGTSELDYTHKLRQSAKGIWIVFFGKAEYRQRSTGKLSSSRQKQNIKLSDFDVTKEAEKLDQSEKPRKRKRS